MVLDDVRGLADGLEAGGFFPLAAVLLERALKVDPAELLSSTLAIGLHSKPHGFRFLGCP